VVVVVFIGFVLVQRENRASDETECEQQIAAKTGRAQKDAEETAQTELRPGSEIKKETHNTDSPPGGFLDFTAATSVARGQ
jgi:hypothetical protein